MCHLLCVTTSLLTIVTDVALFRLFAKARHFKIWFKRRADQHQTSLDRHAHGNRLDKILVGNPTWNAHKSRIKQRGLYHLYHRFYRPALHAINAFISSGFFFPLLNISSSFQFHRFYLKLYIYHPGSINNRLPPTCPGQQTSTSVDSLMEESDPISLNLYI